VRSPSLLRLTLAEVLTVVITIVVLAAIAVPMWRTHELRTRRERAVDALLAVQAAQDQHFASHARYADESHLQKAPGLRHGDYRITVETSGDGLAYWATARVDTPGPDNPDARCVQMRIDQNGRRFAVDSQGVDRSADCWRSN
jgi:type IV pilus assembly protein PilE